MTKTRYKPPEIGPATPGAKKRMAEIYQGVRESMQRRVKTGPLKGQAYGTRYGERKEEVASRTAWIQFKREYKKVSGRWVPRKKKVTTTGAKKTRTPKTSRKNIDAKTKEPMTWDIPPRPIILAPEEPTPAVPHVAYAPPTPVTVAPEITVEMPEVDRAAAALIEEEKAEKQKRSVLWILGGLAGIILLTGGNENVHR